MFNKLTDFLVELVIISLSFELSDILSVKVFESEAWYIELLIYLVSYMALHLILSIAKYIIAKVKENKEKAAEREAQKAAEKAEKEAKEAEKAAKKAEKEAKKEAKKAKKEEE